MDGVEIVGEGDRAWDLLDGWRRRGSRWRTNLIEKPNLLVSCSICPRPHLSSHHPSPFSLCSLATDKDDGVTVDPRRSGRRQIDLPPWGGFGVLRHQPRKRARACLLHVLGAAVADGEPELPYALLVQFNELGEAAVAALLVELKGATTTVRLPRRRSPRRYLGSELQHTGRA